MATDVVKWLEQLQQGDSRAAQSLWEKYFNQLVRLAQRRLGDLPRRAFDEEDVALSAMNSFVKGVQARRFPELTDETDLWRLLITMTSRKANAQRRRHFAARRNAGKVRGESAFQRAGHSDDAGIAAVTADAPTPQFLAEINEECQQLLQKLEDPLLRDIARWKLQGFTNEEMAQKTGRTVRTIERKLSLIRDCWSSND